MARASVVLPEPSSPLSVTSNGGRAARPNRSPQSISSASVSARCPFAASGGTGGEWPCMPIWMASAASARAADRFGFLRRRSSRSHLEELVAQLRRQLEIHRRGRVPHLLLEHLFERLGVHHRVATRRFGDAPLLALCRACVRDARDKAHLIDALTDRRRGDAVHAVELYLHFAAPSRFLDAALHRARHPIGVKDRASVNVSRRTTHGLNQRPITAEESLLVRVENRDE